MSFKAYMYPAVARWRQSLYRVVRPNVVRVVARILDRFEIGLPYLDCKIGNFVVERRAFGCFL